MRLASPSSCSTPWRPACSLRRRALLALLLLLALRARVALWFRLRLRWRPRSLQLARQFLASKDTPNRQVILITDGLPTAHLEESWLYMLYPPDPLTEEATMRESRLCQQEGITINIFLVPSWSQSEEDIRFAYRLAEQTTGRVFFTAGGDLDRFVVWDYVKQRREVIG